MTNREYLESLDNENLAEFLYDEPWWDWCYKESVDFGGTFIDAMTYWLDEKYQEKE